MITREVYTLLHDNKKKVPQQHVLGIISLMKPVIQVQDAKFRRTGLHVGSKVLAGSDSGAKLTKAMLGKGGSLNQSAEDVDVSIVHGGFPAVNTQGFPGGC